MNELPAKIKKPKLRASTDFDDACENLKEWAKHSVLEELHETAYFFLSVQSGKLCIKYAVYEGDFQFERKAGFVDEINDMIDAYDADNGLKKIDCAIRDLETALKLLKAAKVDLIK